MRHNNNDYEQWSENARRREYDERNRGREENHQPPYGSHIPPVGTPPDYSNQRHEPGYRQDDQWPQDQDAYARQNFRQDYDDEVRRHRRISGELCGEHPASMGHQEYMGSNKRHPGLGYTDYVAGERNNEEYYSNRVHDGYDRFPEERPHKKHETGEFIPGNRRPWNRGDYRHSAAGQYMELPPYEEDNYDRREFRHEGYQGFRETEGFGRREGEIPGEDWNSMDEYPRGHRQGRRTYSKYNDKL